MSLELFYCIVNILEICLNIFFRLIRNDKLIQHSIKINSNLTNNFYVEYCLTILQSYMYSLFDLFYLCIWRLTLKNKCILQVRDPEVSKLSCADLE